MVIDSEPSGNDLPAHSESYSGFIWWLKTGTVIAAVVTFVVVLIIAR